MMDELEKEFMGYPAFLREVSRISELNMRFFGDIGAVEITLTPKCFDGLLYFASDEKNIRDVSLFKIDDRVSELTFRGIVFKRF
jgi:hypothetical protein